MGVNTDQNGSFYVNQAHKVEDIRVLSL
jgi:hypothetical protein